MEERLVLIKTKIIFYVTERRLDTADIPLRVTEDME